jgi:hypothetical protein
LAAGNHASIVGTAWGGLRRFFEEEGRYALCGHRLSYRRCLGHSILVLLIPGGKAIHECELQLFDFDSGAAVDVTIALQITGYRQVNYTFIQLCRTRLKCSSARAICRSPRYSGSFSSTGPSNAPRQKSSRGRICTYRPGDHPARQWALNDMRSRCCRRHCAYHRDCAAIASPCRSTHDPDRLGVDPLKHETQMPLHEMRDAWTMFGRGRKGI